MNKWKPGDPRCDCCSYDWYEEPEENIWLAIIGTYVVPACGDGCCHERVVCDWCNGTGIEPNESSEALTN